MSGLRLKGRGRGGVLIIINTLNLRLLRAQTFFPEFFEVMMIDRGGLFGSSKKCVCIIPFAFGYLQRLRCPAFD